MSDTRAFVARVVGWFGCTALAEGTLLGVMLWLLGDTVALQKSFQGYGSDDGPLTLFALAAFGMGWLNARLISTVWGIGLSAAFPVLAQILLAIGIAWGVGSFLLTAPWSEWYDVLIMVGIVMGGTSAFMIRFDL